MPARTNRRKWEGNELIGVFPEIAVALNALPHIVLDGELVVLDEIGRPEFDRPRRRSAMRDPATIMSGAVSDHGSFDILQLKGKDLRGLPLRSYLQEG